MESVMTTQDWDAIGEMVGGLAVIVTLGYLALQLRQSSMLTRAMIRQNVAESVRSMAHVGLESDVYSNIMYRVSAGGDLTEEELSRHFTLELASWCREAGAGVSSRGRWM